MMLLDTHTLLWLVTEAPSLGEKARRLADEAQVNGELFVAAVSWWEIGMLAVKGRITLMQEPSSLRDTLLSAGLGELTQDGHVGLIAAQLADFHGDPADRMIVATSLVQGCTLLTADKKILAWPGRLLTQNARL